MGLNLALIAKGFGLSPQTQLNGNKALRMMPTLPDRQWEPLPGLQWLS